MQITYLSAPTGLQHFDALFSHKKYEDAFGYSPEWSTEIGEWLMFIKKKDKTFYVKNKNRFDNEKQRDETLGEYKAAYFLEEKLNWTIRKFEPKNGELDLCVSDKNGVEWMADVKSPSWRNEVVQEIGEDHPQTIKNRLSKPQYISGEGRNISLANASENPVGNALKKFDSDTNNMIIITPNMFTETVGFASLFNGDGVRHIVQSIDTARIIKRICILEVILPLGRNFEYRNILIDL